MVLFELLAPAGSYDIFVVAVNAGADAVYLAGDKFGARAFAKNFTLEEIEKSVKYAHLNEMKVYITVNTLINNFEIVDVLKYLFKLYKIGVDGVIIQDYGIVNLINRLMPNLKIHASTQMTLNNYSSLKWAVKNNIKRVVLPRELNIDEIYLINEKLKKDNLQLELEVFGHGALCYSISGNCYMSSYNSGRSGNRGACAQPCRREYRLKYRGYNIGNGFLLSTHDLGTFNQLDKIASSGVTSLKLEGRMKSEDYIGTVVNSYRNLIDGNSGNFIKDLHLVFNRKFTKGYLLNEKAGKVMGRGSSGHEGLYIGDIVKINGDEVTIEVKNKDNYIKLETGDGIAFKYNKKIKGIYLDEIVRQNKEEIVIKTTRLVKEGTEVFISYSKSTHNKLKKFKKEELKSKIPLNLNLNWNNKLNLTINIKNKSFNFKYKTTFEKAMKRPLSKEDLIKHLSKTGGTAFYIENIKINNMPKDIFLPIRKINQIRRDILDEAQKLLLNSLKPTKKEINKVDNDLNKFIKEYKNFKNNNIRKNVGISIFVDNLDLLKVASGFNIKRVYFDGNCLYNNKNDYYENILDLLEKASQIASQSEIVWVLSSFISEEEAIKSKEIIENLQNKGIPISVMGDFPGMKNLFNCNIYGHHNLNVWNSYAVEELANSGFNGLVISSELSKDEIKEMNLKNKNDKIELDMIVNGNLEVIVTKDDFSNLNEGKDFIIGNNTDYAILEDKKRKKFKYKVAFDYNKQSHIINKDCLCLIDEINEIKKLGLSSIILDCRYSNEQYTTNILNLYGESLKGKDDEELSKYRYQVMDFSQSYISKGNYIEGRLHEKEKT